MKPMLLDLFCGAGGAAMGYDRAGFNVVGVDIAPQPNYPFDSWEDDALGFLARHGHKFDAVHASPPCQRYSTATRMAKRDEHPDLVAPTRDLLEYLGLPYVIENVPGSPVRPDITLCGSMFGLGVRRHRLFESNMPLTSGPCRHEDQPHRYLVYDHGKWYLAPVVPVYGSGGGKAKEEWPAAMGIEWMTTKELAQAIPPRYTEHIGTQLLARLAIAA